MRPIAKWRGREQERFASEFQAARISKPGGFFARLDRTWFARLALARLVLPRAGGATSHLCRAESRRQRCHHLAAQSPSAGRRGHPRRFRFLRSFALLVLGLLRDARGGAGARPVRYRRQSRLRRAWAMAAV